MANMITHFLYAWAATFVIMLVLDALWLGLIARRFYADAMGDLMAKKPRWGAAALFYLAYPAGLAFFAVLPGLETSPWLHAGLKGALFGMFCYGTYDLTNLAVVRHWPLKLSLADLAWGTLVSGVSSAGGAAVLLWLSLA